MKFGKIASRENNLLYGIQKSLRISLNVGATLLCNAIKICIDSCSSYVLLSYKLECVHLEDFHKSSHVWTLVDIVFEKFIAQL